MTDVSVKLCNFFLLGFSCCPYYLGLRNSEVSTRRELAVHPVSDIFRKKKKKKKSKQMNLRERIFSQKVILGRNVMLGFVNIIMIHVDEFFSH